MVDSNEYFFQRQRAYTRTKMQIKEDNAAWPLGDPRNAKPKEI